MGLVAAQLWPGLGAAFLVGIVSGWRSFGPGRSRWAGGGVIAATLGALVVLTALSVFKVVPDRPGLWVESALLHLIAYLAGGIPGWAAASIAARRRSGGDAAPH